MDRSRLVAPACVDVFEVYTPCVVLLAHADVDTLDLPVLSAAGGRPVAIVGTLCFILSGEVPIFRLSHARVPS